MINVKDKTYFLSWLKKQRKLRKDREIVEGLIFQLEKEISQLISQEKAE